MANTYTQIYIQIVFAVRNRQALIHPEWETELYKFITGTIQKHGQKLITINGVSDHIHIFIGIKPTCCISDLVREIKKSSNKYINDQNFTKFNFEWQGGLGAFSYSHSHISNVSKYIENQKIHHKKQTFKDEYLTLLKVFKIEYKDEYLFEWLD